jgi:hypothetical protein
MALDWSDYSHEFEDLGTGRDVLVQNASINDWQKFWKWVQEEYEILYHLNGEPDDPPEQASQMLELAQNGDACTFQFTAESMDFSGYFWPGEIELGISAADVQNDEQFDDLLRFMQALANELNKPVLLTHEMNPDELIFAVDPKA